MKQPIILFSKVHSSTSKDYVSANTITFEEIDKIVEMLNKRKLMFQGEEKECYASVVKV